VPDEPICIHGADAVFIIKLPVIVPPLNCKKILDAAFDVNIVVGMLDNLP